MQLQLDLCIKKTLQENDKAFQNKQTSSFIFHS